ncbi:MAG: nucleotide pyrophosphohydrolase, partial [Verrucomicrobiota bacterium]
SMVHHPLMTVDEINEKIRQFRDTRDWMQFHRPKDMAMAISIEASELLEHFLWKTDEECEQTVATKKDKIEEEIADIAVYVFELAENLNIDLLDAMSRKIDRNGEKYPVEKARGSHLKYTELD